MQHHGIPRTRLVDVTLWRPPFRRIYASKYCDRPDKTGELCLINIPAANGHTEGIVGQEDSLAIHDVQDGDTLELLIFQNVPEQAKRCQQDPISCLHHLWDNCAP